MTGDSKTKKLIPPGSKNSDDGHDEYRYVYINDGPQNNAQLFCSNTVVTSKYTFYSFLPKFLFESFRKLANAYFLLISLMQLIKPISNTNGIPTLAPTLTLIIAVDGIFAALEDIRRHKADKAANTAKCLRLVGSEFTLSTWDQLRVGDFVKIGNYDIIPADILIVSASTPEGAIPSGICYVETKSLDGETNLKLRQSCEQTMRVSTVADLRSLKGTVTCETPNNAINKFTGTLELNSGSVPIPPTSLLLRGCTLRNTEWVYGLVINTGPDTKIMQAATATPSKWSSVDWAVNKQLIFMVCMLSVICFIGAMVNDVWREEHLNQMTYLAWTNDRKGEKWIVQFFYYFLLMYQYIPLSLYVTMSTVKFWQAIHMSQDLSMYHEESDTPMIVRTMSLNEELGQVQYIFSDKTGTLTCNVMDFRKCSINGVSYGYGMTEIGLAALRRQGKEPNKEDLDAMSRKSTAKYVNFYGPELLADLRERQRGPEQQQFIIDFFTHLAVCHTVVAEKIKDGSVALSASSPDEQALVSGAQYFGYEFYDRTPGKCHIRVPGGTAAFDILDVLEFNSTRKRMSCIARRPDGRLVLYTKGADMVMWPRLTTGPGVEPKKIATVNHMEQYASDGLRTLAIAQRFISEEEYATWGAAYKAACGSLEQIELRKAGARNQIDELMDQMETGLTLLGATAIEDKLQDGVPQCIADLAVAGIKIWVLTGDKEETAINIGFACQLLDNTMHRVVINMDRCPNAAAIARELDRHSRAAKQDIMEQSALPLERRRPRVWALVIDGEALDFALKPELKFSLLRYAQYCRAVIACRVSPAQKAYMVELVKNNLPNARTLAIGDGANDVPMIQAAHIGVGISGQEGLQAVNASDYAIAQFRFLKPLLLVHGRSNLRRIAKVVLYCFYKNVVLVSVQFFYTLTSGGSGQKFYSEVGVQMYNVLYTAFPIVLLGVYDRDVSKKIADAVPRLYRDGQADEFFSSKIFWSWIGNGFLDSVIIFVFLIYGMESAGEVGESLGVFTLGFLALTTVVVLCNIKLISNQYAFNWFTLPLIAVGILFWLIVAAFLSDFIALDYDFHGVFEHGLQHASYWGVLPLVLVLTSGRDSVLKAWKRENRPEYYHLAQEVQLNNMPISKLDWPFPEPPVAVYEVGPPLGPPEPGESSADIEAAGALVDTSTPAIALVVAVENESTARGKHPRSNRDTSSMRVSTGFAFSGDLMTGAAEARLVTEEGMRNPQASVAIATRKTEGAVSEKNTKLYEQDERTRAPFNRGPSQSGPGWTE